MKNFFFALLLLAAAAAPAQEDQSIAVLKSDAPLIEKAAACRELARIGTRAAVPTLARLLADEQLSHFAQYALAPIPDPSVDTALRDALGKVKGRQLMGVIHTLGVRRDKEAVTPIARFLADADPDVAQAAARALGCLGPGAASALEQALSSASPANRPAIWEGLLHCAEAMPGADAAAVYDRLRAQPKLPRHVQVAALRGALRSRGAGATPLLIETIRNEPNVLAAEALRVSLDMPGREVTGVLVKELDDLSGEKQLLLVKTLGRRGDAAAASALVPLAQKGIVSLRVAAIQSLTQLANPASLPVLAALMKDSDAAIAGAAQAALAGFLGREADAAVVAGLGEPDAKMRIAFIETAGQRRAKTALPVLLKAAVDANPDVATASFKALGEIADTPDIPGVADALLQTKAVAAAETALSSICAGETNPALYVDKLLARLGKAQGEPKQALLRVLRTAGDSQALAAVRAAAQETDPETRDTALRALCDWPTAEALPDLAQISRTAPEKKFKILALRGQLRLIPLQAGDDARKLAQVKELLPLIERVEEKRLVLATLGSLPLLESLDLVMPYLADEALKEEAAGAAVDIAEKIVDRHPAEVTRAMKQIKAGNTRLAQRVRQLLTRNTTGPK